MKNLNKLIFAALFSALTFVATYIIKIPTPTMGYIHPGDALVLLCGILLGPLYGGLAAGFGSMLADLISGYATYAPATFVIKLLTAVIASFLAKELILFWKNEKKTIAVIIGSTVGELFMVLGYFVYEIFLLGILTGGLNASSITSGIAASAAGVPFNMVQGFFGVIIATILFPILNPIIKKSLYSN
ncbi:MAG: ECF transporter S component [Lachnospiraceae bacterium]|nr:ECF transporter S component [Lachnospiraceae bacterium]